MLWLQHQTTSHNAIILKCRMTKIFQALMFVQLAALYPLYPLEMKRIYGCNWSISLSKIWFIKIYSSQPLHVLVACSSIIHDYWEAGCVMKISNPVLQITYASCTRIDYPNEALIFANANYTYHLQSIDKRLITHTFLK